jgi:hypothetical protein
VKLQTEDEMSLFDKLREKRVVQSPRDSAATEWLKEYEHNFTACDQSTPPGVSGSKPEDVRAAIIPLLIWGMEPVKQLYSTIVNSFWITRHLPNAVLRVMGCGNSKCSGLSCLLTAPDSAAKERCPHCGEEQQTVSPLLRYSPRVGKEIQQMFFDHSICLYKFERAKTLENENLQEALMLYNDAEVISRRMGNDAVSAMIIIHKARVICFKQLELHVALHLATEALDLAQGLKHMYRKDQLVSAITGAKQSIADLQNSISLKISTHGK